MKFSIFYDNTKGCKKKYSFLKGHMFMKIYLGIQKSVMITNNYFCGVNF